MYESFLFIFAFFIGYYSFNIKKSFKTIKIFNLSLNLIVIFILFLAGYNFSIFTHTNTIILQVLGISFVYTSIIFVTNIVGIFIYCKYNKMLKKNYITANIKNTPSNKLITIIKGSKYLIYLIFGYILGEIIDISIANITDYLVFTLLFVLMLIVGALLKFENISLKNIFKNKDSLYIVMIIVILSIISGILISLFIVDIPIKQSMMICSGLGWYSLSMVLNTKFIGEYYGMITFTVDFSRELLSIALIPLLKRYLSIELIGYSANTAMDFCLPVIKENYGNKSIPLAITIGVMLTIITPSLLILENILL
ncbi:MAG: lysine exporter LysO family protein [Francisella sp.]